MSETPLNIVGSDNFPSPKFFKSLDAYAMAPELHQKVLDDLLSLNEIQLVLHGYKVTNTDVVKDESSNTTTYTFELKNPNTSPETARAIKVTIDETNGESFTASAVLVAQINYKDGQDSGVDVKTFKLAKTDSNAKWILNAKPKWE